MQSNKNIIKLVGSHAKCFCYTCHTLNVSAVHTEYFVLALKRAVLVAMRGNFVVGRLPCSAAGTGCYEDSWPAVAAATRVVLALSEPTAPGSSLPSEADRVRAGGRCVSVPGVG
jgi:hypothetical protein